MKISPQSIRDDAKFKNFIEKREIRESTEILYSRRLSDFCEFTGKSPEELIEEALEEQNLETENQKIYKNKFEHT